MPYELSWHIPDRVLFMSFEGDMSPKEFSEISETLTRMIESSSAGYVHLLVDDSLSETYPPLTQIRDTFRVLAHPKLRWAVAIGRSSRAIGFIAQVVTFTLGVQHQRFDTLEAAMAFLYNEDETL